MTWSSCSLGILLCVLPGVCLGGVPPAELPLTLSPRSFPLERPLTFPRGRRTKRRTRKVLLGSPRVRLSKTKRLRRLLRDVAAAPAPSSSPSRLKKASASRRGAKTLSDVGAWAEKEGATLELKDARLDRRAVEMLSKIGSHPTASIPQAMGTWAGTKGAYRFFDNAKVTREALLEAHYQASVTRLEAEEGSVVIAVQDTTSLDFTSHTDTSGLGPLEHPARQGLLVHSTLGVTPQGLPIGLLGQKVWVRQKKAKAASRTRPFEAKESFRWLEEEQKVRTRLPETFSIVTVADREADVYDLFAADRPASAHLLIRAAQNRRVQQEQRTLWPALEAQPELGRGVVRISRAKDRKEREALLSIRTRSVMILPPKERRVSEGLKPVPLQAIWVHEEAAPRGSTPIAWRLLTTLPGESLEDAVRCLQGYTLRWLVERYHLALKSGCKVEHLHLETAERLERALGLYAVVAWRLLWLTYIARKHPTASCDRVFERHEWEALYMTHFHTVHLPSKPPTLQKALLWTAQLGGFLARKSDHQPGLITIWRGLRSLSEKAELWRLARPPDDVGNG